MKQIRRNIFETNSSSSHSIVLTNDDLESGYSFVSDTDTPTCRSSDMEYIKDVNYTVVIDGFIVSDNIEVISADVSVGDSNLFMHSDHNPVTMRFKLK